MLTLPFQTPFFFSKFSCLLFFSYPFLSYSDLSNFSCIMEPAIVALVSLSAFFRISLHTKKKKGKIEINTYNKKETTNFFPSLLSLRMPYFLSYISLRLLKLKACQTRNIQSLILTSNFNFPKPNLSI